MAPRLWLQPSRGPIGMAWEFYTIVKNCEQPDGAVVSNVASHKEILSGWGLHVLPVVAHFQVERSNGLPPSRDTHVRLIGGSVLTRRCPYQCAWLLVPLSVMSWWKRTQCCESLSHHCGGPSVRNTSYYTSKQIRHWDPFRQTQNEAQWPFILERLDLCGVLFHFWMCQQTTAGA